jgi:hypothetical protein
VVAGNGELTIHHRFLVFGFRRALPAVEVEAIAPQGGMQSGTKLFYDLKVRTRDGRKLSAGGSIPDKHHADWLAKRLREALGLK